MVVDGWETKKLADQQIIASNHHWCLILQIALQDACCNHIRICKDTINSKLFKKKPACFPFSASIQSQKQVIHQKMEKVDDIAAK